MSAVAFTIGNKGYLGTGHGTATACEDFWEYDPATNVWTQKVNFGGGRRGMAVGFSIGNFGYIGTGDYNNANYNYKDLWKYDVSLNTWTQVSDLATFERKQAVGFAIGNKGYVGTGWKTANNTQYFNDFWEYDPLADSWTQKSNFPGTPRRDIDRAVFVIGNSAYLGLGQDINLTLYNDFWEFNQATNSWSQKANFPGVARKGATGFSLCGYGFIGLGTDTNNNYFNDFWMYDPNTDSWSSATTFPGGGRFDQPSFVINDKAYISTGLHNNDLLNSNLFYYDLWEFSLPNINPTISTNLTICIGTAVTLTASGGINYSWATGETTNTINVSPASTTSYSVTVSAFCDSKTLSSAITVINNSNAFFTYEYDPCKNNCVDFTDQSFNALTWEWDFGDGSNSSLQNSCHHYNDSADYNVLLIINKSTACEDTALLSVPYVSHDTTAFVYIPNAFSPNNDGENDVLRFYRKDYVCVKEFEIIIYDRWGEKVFETTNIYDQWDGNYNGKKLDSQTVAYFCKTVSAIGFVSSSQGNITLIR